MTLISVSPFTYPAFHSVGNTAEFKVRDLDAAGEYQAIITQASEALAITTVGLTAYVPAGSAHVDFRIETVGATGFPSGTLWATNTNADIAQTGVLSWNTASLGATANIAAGDIFAIKIVYASGTTASIAGITAYTGTGYGIFPYVAYDVGTPTQESWNSVMGAGLGTSTSNWYNVGGIMPVVDTAITTFNSGTATTRAGLRFQVPFSCRCIGVTHKNVNTTGDFNVVMRDDSGNELSSSSTAFDGNYAAPSNHGSMTLLFDNPIFLSPDTWYRATIEPTSATDVKVQALHFNTASERTGSPWGTNMHRTLYTSAAWDDTATSYIPMMALVLDKVESRFHVPSFNIGI